MFHSVRARLTLWNTALLGLLLTLFGLFGYALLARAIQTTIDSSLHDTADDFVDAWLTESRLGRSSGLTAGARLAATDFRYRDRVVEVFDRNGRLITSSNEPAGLTSRNSAPLIAELLRRSVTGDVFRTVPGTMASEIRVFATQRTVAGHPFTFVVFRAMPAEVLGRMRRGLLFGIPISLAVAALAGYFLAYKSLQPVVAIAAQASGISAGNLHQRLAIAKQDDEMGRLAAVLNDLLSRLEQSFAQQQRLLTDASHELRTPVSIIRGEAEVALSRSDRSPEEYREALAVIHDEARGMTQIVENLFTMARAEARQHPLILSDFYLDDLISDCVRALRTASAGKGVTVDVGSGEEMPIRADEGLLRRLLLNLLENALQHTPPGGRIDMGAERTADGYRILVSDTGGGIPPAAQPFIFEPFFRADEARSRSGGGGAGLGLAIARWIAHAHGGTLELVRSDATGSLFAAILPNGS